MTLSKVTTNFAEKRNIELLADGETLSIYLSDDEPDVIYSQNQDGTFTFKSNLYLSNEVKEELPATIWNEKHLREVVEFLSKEAA